MKRLFLVVSFCVTIFSVNAQFRFDYHASYATYNMKDMKGLMNSIKTSEPFKSLGLEMVEDFPAYIGHSVNIGYRVNNHEFGIKSGFYTTGGKLSVGDYSGKINATLITNGYREGVYYKNYFYTSAMKDVDKGLKDRFSLWGEISPALIISTLKMKTVVSDVDFNEVVEEPEYNESAYAMLIQIGGKYYVTKNISFDVAVGYDLSFGGNYENLIGSPRPDWSGFRLSGGVGLSF